MRADHEFYCSNTPPINHKVNGDVSQYESQYDTRFGLFYLTCVLMLLISSF